MGYKHLLKSEAHGEAVATARRRLMLYTFLLGATTALALAIVNWLSGKLVLAGIEVILGTSVLLVAANLKRFRSLDRAAECVLLAGMTLLITVLFTGGAENAGLYWFSFFPAVSFFWLGLRHGACWTLALVGSAAAITALSTLGWFKLAFEPVQISIALLSTLMIGLINFLYENRRAQDAAMLHTTILELEESRCKAEKLALAKDEFLANMSHEIRTPLNGVIGMTNVLLESELVEGQRESAHVIHDSANVLLSLINNILDFTRMETGHLKLEKSPFNMRTLFEEVSRVVATPAFQKGVEIILEYDEALTSHFMGDKKHLRQILINLSGNAVKFTPSGHVMLRAKLLSRDQKKDRIYFEVSDTGLGIPESQQRKIFDKFSQADTSSQRSFEGSGLGLAISDRLVRMMGGEIAISSAPNKGSAFSFELELESLPGKCVVPAQRLADRRILIIEPYKPLAKTLHDKISVLGAEICHSDGKQVLEEIMQSKPYDIILLDHKTPDALELAAALQQTNRKTKPLVYLLKTPTVVLAAEELHQAGIWATITKPVIQSELIDCLLNYLGAAKKPLTTRPVKKENLHVLLVEDNLVNQKVAHHFLQKIGCRVDLASNGREAVNAAFGTPYDLIFMDCQMPEMDGYDATRAIRENEKRANERSHVPIIALTAHALESDRQICLAVGMDDYLSKPIDQRKLEKVISAYSAGSCE